MPQHHIWIVLETSNAGHVTICQPFALKADALSLVHDTIRTRKRDGYIVEDEERSAARLQWILSRTVDTPDGESDVVWTLQLLRRTVR